MKKKDYLSQFLNNCNSIINNIFFLRFIVIFSFLLYFLPYLINGKSSNILVHDNFDAGWPTLKLLSESGQLFGNSLEKIPGTLNGIVPRACFFSEFNYIFIILEFFDIFWSYVINRVITAIIGFVGMFLILKNHFSYVGKPNVAIIVGISLCFAFLPFYPLGFLSVAGQPLLFYAFLNIRNNQESYYDWLIILFFPFCSSLVYTGLFIGILIFFFLLHDYFFYKKLNLKFLLSFFMLTLFYIFVEYRLFYLTFINDSFISYRNEMELSSHSLAIVWGNIKHNILHGQYHAISLHNPYILITIVVSSVIMLFKKVLDKIFILIIISIISFSFIYGFWQWSGFLQLKNYIPLLSAFNFSRFHWLHPLLWHLCFYISILYVSKYFKNISILLFTMILFQLSLVFSYKDKNGLPDDQIISYNQFFLPSLMLEIDEYIDRPKTDYKIASLGLHPGISHNAGFHTIDGYVGNYPFQFKYYFRKIIEMELNKNRKNKEYFDNWGGRCYLFADELSIDFSTIEKIQEINDLELNTEQMKAMNCQFIFSAVKINNASSTNLKLLKKFTDHKYFWDIYLYRII